MQEALGSKCLEGEALLSANLWNNFQVSDFCHADKTVQTLQNITAPDTNHSEVTTARV